MIVHVHRRCSGGIFGYYLAIGSDPYYESLDQDPSSGYKFSENSINASILGPVLSGGMMEWGTTSVLLARLGRPKMGALDIIASDGKLGGFEERRTGGSRQSLGRLLRVLTMRE